jgi:MscS family membrane protein
MILKRQMKHFWRYKLLMVLMAFAILGGPISCTQEPPAKAAETSTNSVPVADPAKPKQPAEAGDAAKKAGLTPPMPILTFGLDRIEALKTQVFGNPLWQYLASLIYIILAFYVSKLLDYIIQVELRKWAKKTTTNLDDLLLDLLRGPVKVVSFVILLHIGLAVFAWPEWASKFISNGLKIVVACSITYVGIKIVDLLIGYWQQRAKASQEGLMDTQLFPIISKTLKIFVVIVAVLVTSQNLGMNVTGLLASLSIGGLAVGLAAQDTLSNLFGAVAIFADRPFRVGDRVQFDTIDGVVETIGLRSTRIRNLDGHLVTVPNRTVANASISNITKRPTIKTVMNIGLTYDTPSNRIERAMAIIREIYRSNPKTSNLVVNFNKFDSSALNILVVHWWGDTDWDAYLAGLQSMNLELKRRFDEEKLSFAFPSQTVYLRQDSEWRLAGPDGRPLDGGEPQPQPKAG